MHRLIHPGWVALGLSALVLGVSGFALYWTGQPDRPAGGEPLYVYCAEAMRLPLEAVKRDYEAEHGQTVYLHFGPSQTILANLELSRKGDLFLPADDSYNQLARAKKLLGEELPLARMQAVVVVRPGYPGTIKTLDDLLAPGVKLGLANPESAAIGKLVKRQLQTIGAWPRVEKHGPKYLVNVNDVANAALLGSIDAGIVWDTTAQPLPKLTVARLPEIRAVEAKVRVALTAFTEQPDAALRFARYLRARDKGARYFKEQGFSHVEEDEPTNERPTLLVYAGAMLRPAIEETLIEFEKREGVRITRVYNGCGILVSQMKAGERPDLYVACDPRFMAQVQDRFGTPQTVSRNHLVIAVRKGNPHGLHSLKDLGKPGLRVGVGHEQQCALGTITKETFLRTGVYAKVAKNVVVQSATGDLLINQLRTGSLDAVVAYRSNVAPYANELEGIEVTGVDCASPMQPVAIGKGSAHADVCRRLIEALRSERSRQRFEALGFEWQVKEAAE